MAVLVRQAVMRRGAVETTGIVKAKGRRQFASTGFCRTVIAEPRCTG